MKKILLMIMAILLIHSCHDYTVNDIIEENNIMTNETRSTNISSSYYYWSEGVKIPLEINNNKLYAIIETTELDCLNKSILNHSNNLLNINYNSLGIEDFNNTQTSLTSIILDDISINEIYDIAVYIAPYFKTTDGSDIGITNILSVQLKTEEDLIELKKIAKEFNIEIIGKNKFDSSIYFLSCTKESKGNALEMANLIYEIGLFEYATPEFIIESMPDIINPDDTYFNNQWNLNNISNTKSDINYIDAISNFTFPYINDIIVAVVDNGVYKEHEDLPLYNVSYNAHTGEYTSGLYGNHGTLVAGVIGAIANNNKGISGVASGVKIMPISICYTEDGTRLGISASTSTNFANAIRFAADNGARIINNSWSFNTSSPIPEINNAINYAHQKGCIVVFSSGNDSAAVSQPAAGAPSPILVVGASEQNGYRASYSNYGISLDIAAPGTDIWTTNWTGGYTTASGTSLAAPHISGIAALICAINPNLTLGRVTSIIEQSAQKIGNNEYEITDTRLNGPWNQYLGYGLVDANKAVSSVTGTSPSIPSIYCELAEISQSDLAIMGLDYDIYPISYVAKSSGQAIFFIDNYDSNATYVWTSTLPPYSGFDSTFTIEYASVDEPTLYEIKCKALKNGIVSAESGASIAVIPYDYIY